MPENHTPPALNDSSNRSKASAVMREPLAKASATATSDLGGLQKAPATPPITRALDAARPKRSAPSIARQPRSSADESSSGDMEIRLSTQPSFTPIVRAISRVLIPERRRRSASSSKQTSLRFSKFYTTLQRLRYVIY